ncbi:orotidine-5'-phosphate decarboxylase [Dehalococcoidia bacterium]|nr:orotidine-5'-phosphate decarboxylase [Dehalococcoidia bacterium]
MNFIEKLLKASRKNNSLLCIGLDPDPQLMPGVEVVEFNRQIIEATRDLVCAYKPNLAFYEALGIDGLIALEKTLRCIPGDIPVIADAKRGDIGNTARKYVQALFEIFGFDAATVNPYLGHDSVAPFMDYTDRGIFILCNTSNAGAADFQQLRCRSDVGEEGLALFELVAMKAAEWNIHRNIGLVVGATQPQSLRRVRQLCPDMPLLIPGIGAQGGELASAVQYGTDANGEKAIINCSRQVLYASKGKDFPSAARLEATGLREQMNQCGFKVPGSRLENHEP